MFIATLGAIIVYGITTYAIGVLFRFEVPGVGSYGIADVDRFYQNIAILLEGLSHYFAITPTHFDSSAWTISVVRLAFWVALSAASLWVVLFYWSKSLIDTILVLVIAFTFGSFLTSTIPINYGSTRYLFFGLIAATILVARNLRVSPFARGMSAAAVLVALANLPWIVKADAPPEEYFRRVSQFLSDNGLKSGYADFWLAAATSGFGTVDVAPVHTTPRLSPMHWLSREDWFREDRNFFMARNAGERERAIAQFGEPDRELSIAGLTVLAWDAPIRP